METIKILYAKTILCFMFALFLIAETNGQVAGPTSYIDSMAALISQHEIDSAERKKLKDELRERLVLSLSDKDLPKEERSRIWAAIRDLPHDRGMFSAPTVDEPPSIVSEEILVLEERLRQYNDSISLIQEQLIQIVESEDHSKLDKEKSVEMLVSLHKHGVLKYLFENEERLRFGEFDPGNDETLMTYRTVMMTVSREYTTERDWCLMPVFLNEINGVNLSEVGLLQDWLLRPTKFKSSWLLLEFMYENASPESKPLIEQFRNSRHYKKPED